MRPGTPGLRRGQRAGRRCGLRVAAGSGRGPRVGRQAASTAGVSGRVPAGISGRIPARSPGGVSAGVSGGIPVATRIAGLVSAGCAGRVSAASAGRIPRRHARCRPGRLRGAAARDPGARFTLVARLASVSCASIGRSRCLPVPPPASGLSPRRIRTGRSIRVAVRLRAGALLIRIAHAASVASHPANLGGTGIFAGQPGTCGPRADTGTAAPRPAAKAGPLALTVTSQGRYPSWTSMCVRMPTVTAEAAGDPVAGAADFPHPASGASTVARDGTTVRTHHTKAYDCAHI